MKLLAWFNKKEYDKKRQIQKIAASAYFDEKWYYEQYPDVKESGKSAAKHYFVIGWKEGRNPGPDFDSQKYLKVHPELFTLDINPLLYFLETGKTHKTTLRAKAYYFDSGWYAAQYPDYAEKTSSPYRHYLQYGWKEGNNPSKNFDTEFYLAMYPDVAKIGVNPLLHFMRIGIAEGRLPKLNAPKRYYSASYKLIEKSKYFNKNWYMKNNPDLDFKKIDPVEHYLRYGWQEGRNPSKKFSNKDYFNNNPDVEAAEINPLVHYERCGRNEGRLITKPNLYHAYGLWYDVLRKIGRIRYSAEIKKNKKAKILVHLHIFYANAWPEIQEYLRNLDCYDYDLLITGKSAFMQSDVCQKIKQYKPRTRFIECADKGFDLGPFMQALRETDLNRYDVIYHLHSKGAVYGKGRITYKRMFTGTSWFRQLYSGCLGVFNVHRGVDILLHSKEYGVIGADNLVFNDTLARQKVVGEYGKRLKVKVPADYQFIGGSCLGFKSKVLQELKRLKLSLDDFDYSKRGIFTLAHAMERLMVIVALNKGYKIYPLPVNYNNHDREVKKYLAKLKVQDNVVEQKLSAYKISEVETLNMDLVSGLRCTFYRGLLEGKQVFIKWGGNGEITVNEVKMQKMFRDVLGSYVLEILLWNKETPFMVTPYLSGYNLEELKNMGLYAKEKEIIIKSLQEIKDRLKFIPLIHRDIRPANLFFAANRLYLLDYQFATTVDTSGELHELDYIKKHSNISRDLGDTYRQSSEGWNDAFSIDLIISEIKNTKCLDFKAKSNKLKRKGKV